MVSPIGFFCSCLDSFPVHSQFSQQFAQPSGLCFVKILKKPQPIPPHTPFPNFLTKYKCWAVSTILAYAIFSIPNNAYCLDIISFKQYSDLNILVPSKVDLTKLPKGKVFQVNHSQFTLQFFFNNNRDIFGYIFKRKPDTGIMAHLCLYRSCEESPYDLRHVIAKPFEPPYDKTFFSIKFSQKLQYEFQGLEFLPHK